jgi:hypothetical protein
MIVTGRTPFGFGTIKVGKDSVRLFYIFNLGGGSHPLHAHIDPPVSANFELISGTDLTIDSGRYDSVVLRFTPKTAGVLMDVIHIVHDADTQRTKSPIVVGLSGTALSATDTSALIYVSTTSLQLTSGIGSPVTGRFVIRNVSDTIRTLSGVVSGLRPPFDLESGDTTFTLSTGDSAAYVIRFTPQSASLYTDTLHIRSSADSLHRDLLLIVKGSGNDAHPSMSLSIRYVDFGIVPTGVDSIYEIVLGNTGNSGVLYDTVIGPTSGPFSVTQGSGATVMQAKQTRKIDIRFNSSVAGTFVDSLVINTNAAETDAHIVIPLVAMAEEQSDVREGASGKSEPLMSFRGHLLEVSNPSSIRGLELAVFDESGACRLLQAVSTGSRSTVDLSVLPHGTYFVELTHGARSQIKRFVR